MKTTCIFTIYTLIVIVKGSLWAAAVQPIVLTFGAAFTALNLDVQPLFDVNWKNFLFSKEDDKASDPDMPDPE